MLELGSSLVSPVVLSGDLPNGAIKLHYCRSSPCQLYLHNGWDTLLHAYPLVD